MTVADLIERLKKEPPTRTVIVWRINHSYTEDIVLTHITLGDTIKQDMLLIEDRWFQEAHS